MTREEAIAQMRRASSWRTICEVHRDIYDACAELAGPLEARLQDLVIEAFILGKKMDAKLREYKVDWDAGLYEPNSDHRMDSERRKCA